MKPFWGNYIWVLLPFCAVLCTSCSEAADGDATRPAPASFGEDAFNMMDYNRTRAAINDLTNEIKSMEADSAFVQNKMNLFLGDNIEAFEDEARSRGWLKTDEEAFIIKE